MDIRQIHKTFVNGRIPLIVTIVIFIGLRFLVCDSWASLYIWGTTFLQMGIALALLYLNQTFSIIRTRTFLPPFFYLLLVGADSMFYESFIGSVAAFCIMLCFFFLFHTYQHSHSQALSLNISIILTLGSLLWTPLLLFFPLFWYGFYKFKSLTIKTFLASLIGYVVVYLFILAWSVYKSDWNIFISQLPEFRNLFEIQPFSFSLREWYILGFIIILYILLSFNLFMPSISEKIRTISFLRYLYFFALVLLIIFFFKTDWKSDWFLILYIPISLLISHYFSVTNKKATMYLMVLTILFFIGMFVWQRVG